MSHLRSNPAAVIERTLPKTDRSGQARSCIPKIQATPAKELGSRPSRKYRLLRASRFSKAAAGVGDHSRTFLPQYMRM